jgi:4-hydroxy-tetrahydrodipicolinate reductase
MTIKVGVFGAAGRMGRTVCVAVCADPTLELVAAVDPYHEGSTSAR